MWQIPQYFEGNPSERLFHSKSEKNEMNDANLSYPDKIST